jgi:hypothetical protein
VLLLQVTPTLALNFALYDSFKKLWLHFLPDTRCPSIYLTPPEHSERTIITTGSTATATSTATTTSSSDHIAAQPAARHPQKQQQLPLVGSLSCGAAGGFATSTLTYPLDLVRRRMQVGFA